MRTRHRPGAAARIFAVAAPAVILAAVLVVGLAAPGVAGTGSRDRESRNRRVAVGDITVAEGETVDGTMIGIDGRARVAGVVDGAVVVVRGDLEVTAGGTIDGDVVVVRGDALIGGTVDGDVVVIGGRATVRADAVVRGDVSSTDAPRVADGARVTGDVEDIDLAGIIAALGAGILLFWWIAVTLSTALLGVVLLALVPRAFDNAAAVGRDGARWWQALLAGVGLMIGLPLLAVVAVSSVVALPFGLGLLGALGLVHALGYVTGAFFLGRLILRENRFGAFFVGWGILRLLAIVPVFGILVWIAASVYGVGMLAVAAFRAGQPTRPETASIAPTEVAS